MDSALQEMSEQPFPWHLGAFDAHCHPTDTPSSLNAVSNIKAKALTIMATRGEDQDLVVQFADSNGVTRSSKKALMQGNNSQCKFIPSFGWHPWFSHQIFNDVKGGLINPNDKSHKIAHYKSVILPAPEDDDFLAALPEPIPLSKLLAQMKQNLQKYEYALVGEIGLDRSFRLPENWLPNVHTENSTDATPGGREGRRLTNIKVDLDHQRAMLTAQLNLAGEMQRPVSIHGVAAHGVLFETVRETWRGHEREVISKRERKQRKGVRKINADDEGEGENSQSGLSGNPQPFPPRICLHSYSGPPDTLRDYFHASVPADIYVSFSVLVNLKPATAAKTVNVIKIVPDDRVLVESDLHCAGHEMDDLLERMVRCVCKAKDWSLENGVRRLKSNWFRFVFGEEAEPDTNDT